MDIRDPIDAKTVDPYAADAALGDNGGAANLPAAIDMKVRDQHREEALTIAGFDPLPDGSPQDCLDVTSPSARETAPSRPFPHVDAHFRMGGGHETEGTPCQDYATTGVMVGGNPFAIVSDGCSSSGRTDVGARIVALAAAQAMRTFNNPADVNPFVILLCLKGAFEDAARSLGLVATDFDATLCVASAMPDGGAKAMVFGDGVVAARVPGGLDVRIVEWAGNMPGYPNYVLGRLTGDQTREHAFLEQSEAFAAEASGRCCTVRRYAVAADGAATLIEEHGVDAKDALEGIVFEWKPEDGVDSVAVMSDGAMQVSGTEWGKVVHQLTSFGGARNGEFVRRRMTRALSLLAKTGSRPVDDVAVAAIARKGQADV